MQIIAFAFVNRYSIPYDNYYYITKVNENLLNDPLTYSFQLLNTPSYFLLETFYDYPQLFFWSSFFVDLIFSIILFHLIYSFCKNYFLSLIIVMIFSPLFLAIFTKIFTDPGFRLIHVFGYGSYILSTRYVLGFASLFSIFFLFKKKYNYSIIFYSLSLMSHPSTALLLGLFLFITFFFIKLKFKYYINFFIGSLIGLSTILVKLWKLESFDINVPLLSKKEWYLRLINDEPDDFSLLFLISEKPYELMIIISIVSIISFYIFRSTNIDKITKKILYSSLGLPIFFTIAFAIVELASSYFDNYFFIDPIIKTQAGNKILKFCNFPIVFSIAILCKDKVFNIKLFQEFSSLFRITILTSVIIIPLSIIYFNPVNFENKKILYNKLKSVEKNNFLAYLNARFFYYNDRTFGHETYFTKIIEEKPKKIQNETNFFKIKKYNNKLYEMDEIIDENSKKYNSVEVYNHFVSIIKNYIPEKSSVIVLPYFLYIRDVLPNYNFFYLEKNDGNQALGSRLVASIISSRLKDLINVDHKELHSNFSPFLYSDLRRRYLKINDDKIVYLKNKYPEYKYFITESGHELNYEKVFEDNFYIIYKID